jgi:hypothetical protein
MEAMCSSETSGFLRTTRRYNPEEASLLLDTEDGGEYTIETSGSLRTARRYNPAEASLLVDTEVGGDIFHRNVWLSPNCTALQPSRRKLTLRY